MHDPVRGTQHNSLLTGPYPSDRPTQEEPPQGIPGDDTALNGIRLHCSRGNAERNKHVVQSQSGRCGTGSKGPQDADMPLTLLHTHPPR